MPKKKLLGREIRIRKDVVVREHAVPIFTTHSAPYIDIDFGVGPDHTATLTMTKDAWAAFKKGARLNFQ